MKVLVLLLVLLPGKVHANSPNQEEQSLARFLVGAAGQNRPRGEMVMDPILSAVARSRAEDMAGRRYVSHVNPDGHGPNHLIRSAGYSLPGSWGGDVRGNFVESIGAGYGSPEEAWAEWMRSSTHRSHLLAERSFYRNQTNYGIGYYSDPGSPYRTYWVILTAPPVQRYFRDTAGRPLDKGRGAKIRFRSGSDLALRDVRNERAVGRAEPRVEFRIDRIFGASPMEQQSHSPDFQRQAGRPRRYDDTPNRAETSPAPRAKAVRVPWFTFASVAP